MGDTHPAGVSTVGQIRSFVMPRYRGLAYPLLCYNILGIVPVIGRSLVKRLKDGLVTILDVRHW